MDCARNNENRETLAEELRPYGARFIMSYEVGFDLWAFGWGIAFTLVMEDNGFYSAWSLEQMFVLLENTKPSGWPR